MDMEGMGRRINRLDWVMYMGTTTTMTTLGEYILCLYTVSCSVSVHWMFR